MFLYAFGFVVGIFFGAVVGSSAVEREIRTGCLQRGAIEIEGVAYDCAPRTKGAK